MVQIKGIQGSATNLTITLTSLPTGEGRVATQYDGGTNFPIKGWFSVKTKTGASLPIAGSLVEFYLAYSDAQSTEVITDAVSLTDAAIATLPSNVASIGSLVVQAAASTVYQTVFPVFDLPQKWSLIVWNNTNSGLSSTAGDHTIKFIPQYDQTV
jgi:hypothetical protein